MIDKKEEAALNALNARNSTITLDRRLEFDNEWSALPRAAEETF